jgi:Tfp pilus assembly protein PilF
MGRRGGRGSACIGRPLVRIDAVRFQSLLWCFFFTLCLSIPPVYGAADTVAVLPFFNETNDRTLDWIGESVAETTRESLSSDGILALNREDRVEVYRRLSVRPEVQLTRATVLKVGQSLDAGQIVFGKFELQPAPAGTSKMHAGPEFVESGSLEDLSVMESKLAWQTLVYFHPRSSPDQQKYLESHPPVRIVAVESYVRGLLAESPAKQEKYFLEAIRLDPKYSEPAFSLGKKMFAVQDYGPAAGWFEKVATSASHYHEAQFLLGLCRYYQNDFDGAAKALTGVAAVMPLDEVYNDLGAALSRNNKPEAVDNFKKALEGDDADPDYWFNLGYAQWKTGKLADATRSFQAVLDRSPDDEKAQALLKRCERGELPHPGEILDAERIKQDFEETVYLQLQAELKR